MKGLYMDNKIENKLVSLSKSSFRSSFKLGKNDKKYIYDKGIDKIREHAYDFVNKRLSSKILLNDGKQTPMKGHPVFIAQHATGTCCRECLYKWHGINNNKELDKEEIDYIIDIIISWILINLEK